MSGKVTFQPGLVPPYMLLVAECGAGGGPLLEPEGREEAESLVRTRAGGFLEVRERTSRFTAAPAEPVKFAAAECKAGFKIMVFPRERSAPAPLLPAAADVGCISSVDSVVSHGSEVVFNFLI